VNAPSVLYNSIKDDGEFFIYANNGKNRIGFAAEIANAEMIEPAMAGWEGSIVKDTEIFFGCRAARPLTRAAILALRTAARQAQRIK